MIDSSHNSAGLFVAVGHDGLRLTSTDGANWSNVATGKEGEVYRGVCFGGGQFAAVGSYGGSNIFAGTRDGVAWETRTLDAKYSKYLRGVGYGRGEFLAVGGDPGSVGSSSPLLVRSSDGVNWGDYVPFSGKNILRRIAFGVGRFVGVGDRGRRATLTDGLTWFDMPEVKAIDTLVDVAFGGGVFVGVGLHGLRMSTRDGLKWSPRQVGEEGEHLNSVVWTGERFVAVGAGATYESARRRSLGPQAEQGRPLDRRVWRRGVRRGSLEGANPPLDRRRRMDPGLQVGPARRGDRVRGAVGTVAMNEKSPGLAGPAISGRNRVVDRWGGPVGPPCGSALAEVFVEGGGQHLALHAVGAVLVLHLHAEVGDGPVVLAPEVVGAGGAAAEARAIRGQPVREVG